MTQVVAALLVRDGRVLACRRRTDQPHPLKWEFPGGKVEPHETPEQALVRELREELAIEAGAPELIERYRFSYPGKSEIELLFYRVPKWIGEPRNLIFDDMQWDSPEHLARRDFLEGDLRFLAGIARHF